MRIARFKHFLFGVSLVLAGGVSANSGVFGDVRQGFNGAQKSVIQSVIDEVPEVVTGLKSCVGDFGIDVSLNPANWLNSILSRLSFDFCGADYNLADIDLTGGEAEFGGAPFTPDEPYLVSILPQSGEFSELLYEYMTIFYDADHIYPKELVESSNDRIMGDALIAPASEGYLIVRSSLAEVDSAIQRLNCGVYSGLSQGMNRARCEGIKQYFPSRRIRLLSIVEASMAQNGIPF